MVADVVRAAAPSSPRPLLAANHRPSWAMDRRPRGRSRTSPTGSRDRSGSRSTLGPDPRSSASMASETPPSRHGRQTRAISTRRAYHRARGLAGRSSTTPSPPRGRPIAARADGHERDRADARPGLGGTRRSRRPSDLTAELPGDDATEPVGDPMPSVTRLRSALLGCPAALPSGRTLRRLAGRPHACPHVCGRGRLCRCAPTRGNRARS